MNLKRLPVLISSLWLFLLLCLVGNPASAYPVGYQKALNWEANSAGTFIKVGNDITYRRYSAYFSSFEGAAAFAMGLAQLIFNGVVEFHAALEISSLATTRRAQNILFFATLTLMPIAIQSAFSWCAGRRLASEQIKIDSELISKLFYIEFYYDPGSDKEELKLMPVPAELASISDSSDRDQTDDSVSLWLNFYRTLIQAGVTSVQLSWHEGHDRPGVLVRAEGSGSRVQFLEIENAQELPVSVESLLHHEWSPGNLFEDDDYVEETVSLLKEDIIQKVMKLVASSEHFHGYLARASVLTMISEWMPQLTYNIDLCRRRSPGCGSHLQLLWQAVPYPHYRPRLLLADARQYPLNHTAIGHTLSQVADLNIAEQLVRAVEQLVFSVIMAFIRRQKEFGELYPVEFPKTAVTNALINREINMVTVDMSEFTMADWRRILQVVNQRAGQVSMVEACQWLTANQLSWPAFFMRDISEHDAAPGIEPGTITVIKHLPERQQLELLDAALQRSSADFLAMTQTIPLAGKIAFLRASEGVLDTVHELIERLNEGELNSFIDDLGCGPFTVEQFSSLIVLLNTLPFPATERLLQQLVAQNAVDFAQLLLYLIRNQEERLFKRLADWTAETVQNQLVESIVLALTEQGGTAGEVLQADYISWVREDVIKNVVTYISEHHEPGSDAFRSLRLLSALIIESRVHDNSLLTEIIIDHARRGVDVVAQMMIDHNLMNLAMDQVVELKDMELNVSLYQLNPELYYSYLRRLIDNNQPVAVELLASLPLSAQAECVGKALQEADRLGSVKFMLHNADPSSVADAVINHWRSSRPEDSWVHMPVRVVPRIMMKIAALECQMCLAPLLEWLAVQSQDELKMIMSELRLSEAETQWLSAAINTLVSESRISSENAAVTLAYIAFNSEFLHMSALVDGLPLEVTTPFLIQLNRLIEKNPGHFGKVVPAVSMLQAGHYLAALTKSEKLWAEQSYAAYLMTPRLASELDYIRRFEPEELHFQEIREWAEKILESIGFIDKKKLKETLSCSICFSIFENPVMHQCRNNFCKKCIDDWIAKGNAKCPMCDLEIPEGGAGYIPNRVLEEVINIIFGANRD